MPERSTGMNTAQVSMVPDYYSRLGVEPGSSAVEIEAALQKQQPVWSMGTRNPKTRHTNQLYLDEVPALRRALLSTPESRAAYDAELAAAQAAEREARLDELQRRVRLRAAKGGLTAADQSLLSDEAAKLGLGDDVLERLTRLIPVFTAVVQVDAVSPIDDDPPADVLDSSTRRQIRAALEHLGRRDLYDALGLSRDAPGTILAARADEERQRWMRKAQVTAEKTAWLEVIAHAQSHLGTTKSRARYDRTLVLEAEEKLGSVADFALQGTSRLDPGTRGALIEEAAALGIGSERAERLVARACRKKGVALDSGAVVPRGNPGTAPAALSPSNGAYHQLRCRNCSGVTELSPVGRRSSGLARCRHCGASLKWDCPVCHRGHWIDQPKCDCGLALAVREPLVRHFVAAQHAFRLHDLRTAREHLEQVQKFAPQHVGARNGLAKIRQHEAEIESARAAWELANSAQKLVQARCAVEAWRKLVDPTLPEVREVWKEVTAGLRQAEELAARARRLERVDPPAAQVLYRQSLEIAVDLPDALAGLNRCPPDAPTELELWVQGDGIRLAWTAPAPDGLGPLTYAIVRRRGGLPEHPGDGTRIAEVSTCEFEDRHVRPGDTVSYAVLAKRGDVESLAAVAAGPVIYLPDVREVRVEAREREIELSWIPPQGVHEIRLLRSFDSPPSGPRDGESVDAALDQALDRDVEQGQVHHYRIHAIYKTADGRRYPSPGVVVAAIPRPPVLAPAAPRLLLTPGGQVKIDWIEPPRGSVRILRTTAPLPHQPGDRIDLAQAEQLAGKWIERTDPDRTVDLDPPPGSSCYYTLLVAVGRALTVGHTAALGWLSDPSELRATRSAPPAGALAQGSRVLLRWNWAREASATRLVARQGEPPHGPSDPAASVITVPRAEYERQGSWTMNLPRTALDESTDFALQQAAGPANGHCRESLSAAHWYVTAYSLADHEGASVVSPGIEPTATTAVPGPHPEVTVSYTLKPPWIPGRPWTMTLRTDPPGETVPPMVVVANDRTLPLSADEGEVIARLPAGPDGATHPVRVKIPPNRTQGGVRAFVDPTAEPETLSPVRLRHPEGGLARV